MKSRSKQGGLGFHAASMLSVLAALQLSTVVSFKAASNSSTDGKVGTCMDKFIASTEKEVSSWRVEPSAWGVTDRVAATLFNVEKPELLAWKIRWMSRVLGSKWAMQVFYTTEENKKTLDALLGHPQEVIWTRLYQDGKVIESLDYVEFQRYLTSHDHWDYIKHEHVLWFEADSMLLQDSSCVEAYLDYDFTGAPWPVGFIYQQGGNGGFSLQRKSAIVKSMDNVPFTGQSSDIYFVEALTKVKAKFAPREMALSFSNEGVCTPTPCGIHKPVCIVGDHTNFQWESWCRTAKLTFELAKLKMIPGQSLAEHSSNSRMATALALAYTPVRIPFYVAPALLSCLVLLATLQFGKGGGVRAFLVVLAYLMALPLIQVSAKFVLKDLPYPISLSLAHKTITMFAALALERPNWSLALVAMPVSVVSGVGVILGNVALSKGSVAVVAAIATCNPFFTSVLQVLRGKEASGFADIMLICFATLGAMLCVTGELHFSAVCVTMATFATLACSVRNVQSEHLMQSTGGMSSAQLVFWTCLWSSIACSLICGLTEGIGFVTAFQHATPMARIGVLITCVFAVVLNLAGAEAVKLIGSTAQGMVSNLCLIVTMVMGCVLIHEEISLLQLLGGIMAPIGLMVKLQLNKASAASAEELRK